MVRIGSGGLTARFENKFEGESEELADGARFMLTYLARLIRLVDEAYPEVVTSITVKVPLTSQDVWRNVQGERVADHAAT